MSKAGKTAQMKEKEFNLANTGSFANGTNCFLCGTRMITVLNVPIPDAQLTDTGGKIVGKTLRMPTKGVLVGYLGSRHLMVKLRVDWSRYFYKETRYDYLPRKQ